MKVMQRDISPNEFQQKEGRSHEHRSHSQENCHVETIGLELEAKRAEDLVSVHVHMGDIIRLDPWVMEGSEPESLSSMELICHESLVGVPHMAEGGKEAEEQGHLAPAE